MASPSAGALSFPPPPPPPRVRSLRVPQPKALPDAVVSLEKTPRTSAREIEEEVGELRRVLPKAHFLRMQARRGVD